MEVKQSAPAEVAVDDQMQYEFFLRSVISEERDDSSKQEIKPSVLVMLPLAPDEAMEFAASPYFSLASGEFRNLGHIAGSHT